MGRTAFVFFAGDRDPLRFGTGPYLRLAAERVTFFKHLSFERVSFAAAATDPVHPAGRVQGPLGDAVLQGGSGGGQAGRPRQADAEGLVDPAQLLDRFLPSTAGLLTAVSSAPQNWKRGASSPCST